MIIALLFSIGIVLTVTNLLIMGRDADQIKKLKSELNRYRAIIQAAFNFNGDPEAVIDWDNLPDDFEEIAYSFLKAGDARAEAAIDQLREAQGEVAAFRTLILEAGLGINEKTVSYCVHCQKAVPVSEADHWLHCKKHPAKAIQMQQAMLIAGLKSECEKLEYRANQSEEIKVLAMKVARDMAAWTGKAGNDRMQVELDNAETMRLKAEKERDQAQADVEAMRQIVEELKSRIAELEATLQMERETARDGMANAASEGFDEAMRRVWDVTDYEALEGALDGLGDGMGPLCRVQGWQDGGDESVGMPASMGMALAGDQSGTVLQALIERVADLARVEDAALELGPEGYDPIFCIDQAKLGLKLSGCRLIIQERLRQIQEEGWTAERDDKYINGDLAQAGSCYATFADVKPFEFPPKQWPLSKQLWKLSNDPVRNLVKAGALIAAEIDRLLRKQSKKIEDERNGK